MDTQWTALRRALDPALRPPRPGGRTGAALVLLSGADGDLRVCYTRRCDDLPDHPGQVSFPGGRVEPGETLAAAALREAAEEVGLDPATVEVLGGLPAHFIPPSGFWLHPVVARWRDPHRLEPDEREVAEILSVPLPDLRDPARWRVTRLPSRGPLWAWRLDGDHLLWGATAAVTRDLLGRLDPAWHGGSRVEDLPPEREEQPWAAGAARRGAAEGLSP